MVKQNCSFIFSRLKFSISFHDNPGQHIRIVTEEPVTLSTWDITDLSNPVSVVANMLIHTDPYFMPHDYTSEGAARSCYVQATKKHICYHVMIS